MAMFVRSRAVLLAFIPFMLAAAPVDVRRMASVGDASLTSAGGAVTRAVTVRVSSQAVMETSRTGEPVVTGYVQKVQVERRPRVVQVTVPFDDSSRTRTETRTEELSPQWLGCGTDAVVEVIANEITLGQNGPHVPSRVDWKLGAGAWQPGFADANVAVGMEETWDLSAGGELLVRGKMAYPSFDSFFLSREIASDDANFVLILVDGDDPIVKMDLKGAQGPYGEQASIPTILAPYMDGNGLISLPSNELLALYEMGSTSTSEPTADYQDLVLKIRTGCPIGSEVVLRDSIGVDNTWTNGNWPFASDRTSPTSWYMAPATVQVNENITLTEFRGIVAQMTPMSDFNQLDYWLRVWSSEAAAIANPNDGDIADIFFPVPTSGPFNFGSTVNQNFIGVKPTWDLRFDISSANLQVLAGQSIVIGVQVYTNGTSGGGLWGWMESMEVGSSDIQTGHDFSGGWRFVDSSSRSFHNGRLGIKLTGQTL